MYALSKSKYNIFCFSALNTKLYVRVYQHEPHLSLVWLFPQVWRTDWDGIKWLWWRDLIDSCVYTCSFSTRPCTRTSSTHPCLCSFSTYKPLQMHILYTPLLVLLLYKPLQAHVLYTPLQVLLLCKPSCTCKHSSSTSPFQRMSTKSPLQGHILYKPLKAFLLSKPLQALAFCEWDLLKVIGFARTDLCQV